MRRPSFHFRTLMTAVVIAALLASIGASLAKMKAMERDAILRVLAMVVVAVGLCARFLSASWNRLAWFKSRAFRRIVARDGRIGEPPCLHYSRIQPGGLSEILEIYKYENLLSSGSARLLTTGDTRL